MPMHTTKADAVYNRLREWLLDQSNAGEFVTNVAIDLMNRANQRLWGKAFWDDLMVYASLTVGSDRYATLPVGYGKTYCVYHDQDSDGKPDWYYTKDGKYGAGYRRETTFTKAAGKVFKLLFFRSPDYTAYILYQKILDDFALATIASEYVFFPEELLLSEAQLLHKEDADDASDGNYDRIKAENKKQFQDFKRYAQFTNPAFIMEQNDAAGNPVESEAYDLAGGGDGIANPFSNSTDTGLL